MIVSDEILFYSQLIASIVGLCVLCILLVYHCVSTYLYSRDKSIIYCTGFGWPPLLICSFLMQIFGIFYCLCGLSEIIWIEYISRGELVCFVHFLLLVNFYGLFKLSLYMALCRRLVESFSESSLYSYSNKFYLFWQSFLVLLSLVLIIASSAHIEASYDGQLREPCVINVPQQILISLVGYDVIVGMVNLLLFIMPLRKLTADLYDQTAKMRNRFKTVMYKNASLSCITVLVSFITWIFMLCIFKLD